MSVIRPFYGLASVRSAARRVIDPEPGQRADLRAMTTFAWLRCGFAAGPGHMATQGANSATIPARRPALGLVERLRSLFADTRGVRSVVAAP
jgi:hypothetical protein